jgi:hypothetical protein
MDEIIGDIEAAGPLRPNAENKEPLDGSRWKLIHEVCCK